MLQKPIRWKKAAGLAVTVQIFLFTCVTVFVAPKLTSASQDRTKRNLKIITEKVPIATMKTVKGIIGAESPRKPLVKALQRYRDVVKTAVPGIIGTEDLEKPKHVIKKTFVKQGKKVMTEMIGTEGPLKSSIGPMNPNTDTYAVEGKISNWAGGTDADGDDFYETYNFWFEINADAIPGPMEVSARIICVTTGQWWSTSSWFVEGTEKDWRYAEFDETNFPSITGNTTLDWTVELWTSDNSVFLGERNTDVHNENVCKVDYFVDYKVIGKIDNWVGGIDADGDDFYETYNFRIGFNADAIPGPVDVYVVAICETVGLWVWNASPLTIEGNEQDWYYYFLDETYFNELIKGNTILEWTLYVLDTSETVLAMNTEVVNEHHCQVDNLSPNDYFVYGEIDNWVGGTDADGDGYYETYNFRVGIDADAVPGPGTVTGKLICETTDDEWWLPSSWIVSGRDYDYVYKTFDETDFPSIQDNTTLDWTVEIWNASKRLKLAMNTDVENEALCKVDKTTNGEVLISIPTGLSCQAAPGATFTAPVTVSDLTGKNVFSYTIVITFDATRLEATGVDVSGTISSGWGPPTSTPASGQITIAGAGTSTLSGSGTLVNVNMRVNAGYTPATNETVDIHIQSAQLNEGSPSATTSDGSVIFVDGGADISGMVKYFQADRPISNTTVNLSGDAIQNKVTGSSGTYQFTGLSTGQNYQVSTTRTGGQGSGISAYDASFILRYAVGSQSLSADQLIAADASGNGSVTAFDASIILRYVVGTDVSTFVVGNWLFSPKAHSYSPLSGDQTNQDFTGILIGDVSGNWSAPAIAKSTGGSVVLGEAHFNTQGFLELPIGIEGPSSCYSAGVELEIEADLVSVENVAMFEESDEAILVYREDAGKLRIALASSEYLKDGDLLKVLFRIDGENITEEIPIVMTAYTLDESRVEDLHEAVFVVRDELPTAFELKPNYPNPFNPVTHFVYTLPERSDVQVHIYNMTGQRVRELVHADQEAGKYEVIWDGRDDMGFELPSGVYFVICRAAQYNRSMKIIKMK